MDDAELVRQLRLPWFTNGCEFLQRKAADRIEALIAERDRQYDENVHRIAEQARVEAERDAARDAALEEAARKLHWMWNADGTPTERRVAEESAAATRRSERKEP